MQKQRPKLTARQREVYAFVRQYMKDNVYAPTLREISEHFGFSSVNAAKGHLKLIAQKGYLNVTSRISRGIRLT